ncbi:MAG: PSD1 and planctomycete cytochrome C domain-containing protein, partial [Planctomycetaceae bacterium]|nr:PSD1 and planctomycete cytochrome C domain-containing protein [Planctomycetaceae bacterium]
QTVAETDRQKTTTNAHQKVVELPPVPAPGMRPAAMGDHETLVEMISDGTPQLLLWEMVVGGPRYRMETGENSLSVAKSEGMFHLVSAVSEIPLTDAGWLEFTSRQRHQLESLDRMRRQRLDPQIEAYWRKRHQQSQQLIAAPSEIPSIDSVIDARLRRLANSHTSRPEAADSRYYTANVRPILVKHCARCHMQKQQGDFRLTDRSSLLRGGESGQPAVVPGKPDESPLLDLVAASADDYRMPPLGDGLSDEEVQVVRQWIASGVAMPEAAAPDVSVPPAANDYTFLRRVYLDTVGVPPTRHETVDFLNDSTANRRQRLIRRLLRDERWADNWTGYWQDVLAENPNLLKPTLNNTGPFRYWIHEALEDNKPADRFATELITMRGSRWSGGAAGFELASQNDVPMAAKAMVVSSAFLGVNLKCARCHDAPYHEWTQGQLFQMAAMLDRNRLTLPTTSTVPAAFFEKQQRKSLIEVSLRPGAQITGEFPFPQFDSQVSDALLQNSGDSRERAALKVTTSRRFAEVIANRLWQRLMGAGVVDPVDDWAGNPPSSPELLSTLADLLIVHHYDMKALVEEILNSRAYQRQATDLPTGQRLFAGPYRRRMTAEQIVDSAFHVTGVPVRTEELTLDVEGAHPASRFLNFGFPRHAWEYTTLANERDRPSLSLPRIQAVTDVLRAFGWRNARPEPASHRDSTPNLIQPGVLANGTVGVWLTRLSDDHGLLPLMLSAKSVDELIDELYLRLLTRRPTARERREMQAILQVGFEDRVVTTGVPSATAPQRFPYVSWSNHLNTRANVIKLQMQELARQGDPPTSRLQTDWRERAEDAIWSLLNSPEMILVP